MSHHSLQQSQYTTPMAPLHSRGVLWYSGFRALQLCLRKLPSVFGWLCQVWPVPGTLWSESLFPCSLCSILLTLSLFLSELYLKSVPPHRSTEIQSPLFSWTSFPLTWPYRWMLVCFLILHFSFLQIFSSESKEITPVLVHIGKLISVSKKRK